MRLAMAFAAAASLVIACNSAEPADFQVAITSGSGDAYTLLIYDDSGVVTGARPAQWHPGMQVDEVVSHPETSEVEIGWTGGACAHNPSFEISGIGRMLQIEIFSPSDPNWLPFLPIGCPAVGVPLRVALSIAEPVISVDLRIRR